ncbi:hypothetical protein [Streptomyces sp. NBC_00582]|uniref:hypothetical protein n=1 Tax=Streptomyces sp. NBC_00582 TaxID=2975783 RepID=UPI002E8060C5|nr:hypothetical protein [Streptomyces sp. NBC_00582]WUB68478.1 hypothetical protein OG852_50145 [Streptomyces sp. NBC_00582]
MTTVTGPRSAQPVDVPASGVATSGGLVGGGVHRITCAVTRAALALVQSRYPTLPAGHPEAIAV